MGCLRRLFGLSVIVFILMVTPCAFWAFNIRQLSSNPQTYKTALNTQNVYNNILPALVEAAASSNPNNTADPQIREAAVALRQNMSADDWNTLAAKLLPSGWLQEQLNGNIDRFFAWLDGGPAIPDIHFDLSVLKQKMAGPDVQAAFQIIVPKLPTCTEPQMQAIVNPPAANAEGLPPLCNPTSDSVRTLAVGNLVTTFQAVGTNLPDSWQFAQSLATSSPNAETQLSRLRAALELTGRLLILLFLVPIGLFSLIVIFTIRSSKQLFRWLGWCLLLSGLFTLMPIPLVTGPLLAAPFAPAVDITSGELLLNRLMGGMVASVASGLTLAVLIQVAVVVVIGFISLAISIVLPATEPDVPWHDMAHDVAVEKIAENMAASVARQSGLQSAWQQQAGGSTPRPFGSTPAAPPMPQNPSAPQPPDPLADLFNDDKL